MVSATSVLSRVVILACVGCLMVPPAGADPAPDAVPVSPQVPPKEPATVRTPDGWTLTVGTRDEAQVPVAPLTTAISSREYVSSGTYFAELIAPEGEAPEGTLEAGYQIGCGIDMSTANGVTMSGSAGMAPGLGAMVPIPPGPAAPFQLLPALATPITGVVTVGLKPGLVFIVPVHQKVFKGAHPWVMISEFHVKIDGCVGQSFIRSYAVLTRETEESDVVLSYVGSTTTV